MSVVSPATQQALLSYLWILAVFSAATLGASCYWQRIKTHHALLILAIALGCNAYITALQPTPGTTSLSQFCNNRAINVTGTVSSIAPQPCGWRMDVIINQIESRHRHYQVQGKLRVKVLPPSTQPGTSSPNQLTFLPGDIIVFNTKIRQPRPFRIPGEFNYQREAARCGIFYSALITNSNNIVRLTKQEPAFSYFERWRTQLGRKVAILFPPEQSAYLLSLTLGQKTRLSTDQRNQLSNYGISHLFSISGLHLGLLAGLIYKLIIWFYRRSERLLLLCPAQKAAMVATVPFIIAYLLLSGAALPTLRAALLIGTGVIALVYNRYTPSITLLALVALLILGCSPLALFSASFQLSFAGVAAILLCLPHIEKQCTSKLSRWTILPLAATIVATLATAPIALWHFHTLAPAGILCNLFAIPIIGLITVPLALCGTMVLTITPAIALPVLKLSLMCINTTLLIAQPIASGFLAGKSVYLSPLQHLLVATICLTTLIIIARRWHLAAATLCTCIVLWLFILLQPPPAPLELTAFSVGQGDSLLLRLGEQKNYLIDGGGLYSKTFDVGQRLLAPALGTVGIRHLDAVILSHDHPDHRKGLIYILRHFAVDQFWCSIPVTELHFSLQQVLNQRHIPIRLFTSGWTTVPLHREIKLDIFVPPDGEGSMNDRSLVVLAHYLHDGVLLTGDLEKHGVEQLLAQPLPTTINILKLPHHGSRRSLPDRLLEATQAKIAIACVGYGNHYGFPHPEVVDAVHRHGAKLLRTDSDGSIRFSSWGKGWTTTTLK
jgi:competence protein ComEC